MKQRFSSPRTPRSGSSGGRSSTSGKGKGRYRSGSKGYGKSRYHSHTSRSRSSHSQGSSRGSRFSGSKRYRHYKGDGKGQASKSWGKPFIKGESHRYDRKKLLQRSKNGECLHCGDKSHQVRNCPKVNFGRRSSGSGSGKFANSHKGKGHSYKGSGHSKGHSKGGRVKPSSRVKFGAMEEDPQDQSWEGMSKMTLNGTRTRWMSTFRFTPCSHNWNQGSGENHSRIPTISSTNIDVAQWLQGMELLGQRKKDVITPFPHLE